MSRDVNKGDQNNKTKRNKNTPNLASYIARASKSLELEGKEKQGVSIGFTFLTPLSGIAHHQKGLDSD